ncbi:MAG TPA: DUF11 domain-containing protein, partial [Alphaproteobacteria bacterium]|nr:DUF11 domain-containing protein [Alphaproteobacteria bacterium]
IQVDGGSPGLVDPGDVLRYTITVQNLGSVPATNATLTDPVPANTTYVTDSTALNGLAVGQPDAGVAPLAAGIPISSADLTPPLPGPGTGVLTPGQTATIVFDVQVDAGVPAGTLISNQAVVATDQLPNLLSDGDGNPSTGPEPTVVVVGDGQRLTITKQVAVVGGGAALPGAQLEYVVRVVNVASVPAVGVVITDDLDAPVAGQLAYVASSATMNGASGGISVTGSVLTADWSAVNGPLPPGGTIVLRFRAVLAAGLAMGTTVTNTGVVAWNSPIQTASASVSIDVGGMPGVGVLNGTIWHDADFDRAFGAGERTMAGWVVELLRNDQPVQSVATGADGVWRMAGVAPNDTSGDRYALRFRAADAGPRSAALGRAASVFTNGLQTITDVIVPSGGNLQSLDLPIDPNGVVYDALERLPISGARLSMLNAASGTALPSACFDDPVQQGQVTRGDGYYKFDLNFADASCPSGGDYLIAVTAPGGEYAAGYSAIIPPTTDASTSPFGVPACPGSVDDAVPTTTEHCESQPSELPPAPSVIARSPGTRYHVHLSLDASQPSGSSQIFNNHIPLD